MATRPETKHGVTITPARGLPVLILVESSGAASALTSQIRDNTDGSAVNEGAVYELPLISTLGETAHPDDVQRAMETNFSRALVGRRLLELRDVAFQQDSNGDFWRATALWAFDDRPKAVAAEPAS